MREPVSRSVSRSRNARSKRALCATSTPSPAKARNCRTASGGRGAPRSCSVRRPVTALAPAPIGSPGSTRVSNSASTSKPRRRTAPISQIPDSPGRRPVVSRSTTTYVASSSRSAAPSGSARATASPLRASRASVSTTSASSERASATGACRRAKSRRAASSASTGPRCSSTSSTRRSAASSLSCMAESLGEHTFARQLAPLRTEPAADAEQVTQALAGEPLDVLEKHGDWVRVETAYAYPGWVRREDLAGESDAEWLRPVPPRPVEHARSLLDTRYEWGGMTCAGIDCSGLVHMAFRACGRLVPRDADQQEAAAERLSEDDLRSGDLITYGPAAEADHIAFWVGRGRILHATGRDGVERVIEEKEPAELRRRRRALLRLGAVAGGLLSLLLAVGCGSSGHTATSGEHHTTSAATTAAAPKAGAAPAHQFPDFRIAMDEATDYLDPGLSDTTEGWGVMWNVYLPLLGYRHANGRSGAKLVPYLATSLPQISRDERTYRLTLREGLRYSNGQPVTASDFKKTVERDFLLDSAGAGFFRNIVGAKVFAKRQKGRIRGIVVDDPTRTILIHLVAPQADFANVLASEFAAPVPASSPPADTSLHPLPSTGPYAITSYRPRERIVEERN